MAQQCCEASIVYRLPSTVFVPRPKVDAAVVRLVPLAEPLAVPFEELESLVNALFQQRRKTVRNNLLARGGGSKGDEGLDPAFIDAALVTAGVAPNARPQDLSLDEIRMLYEALSHGQLPQATSGKAAATAAAAAAVAATMTTM
jgi:16S rRNA (adenine1518-N6/adenine1519-N6)-dimethyltransferase